MKLLTAMLVFFSLCVANADKCCFCEIGDEPQNEQVFFEKGCRIWLKGQQNCTSKEIVGERTQYQYRDLKCDELAVGYVGHWSSSLQTGQYLYDVIAPTMSRFPLKKVTVDNTACKGMDNPEFLDVVIHTLPLKQGQKLTVIGNQPDSIGMWEFFLGHSYNFWAKIENDVPGITFPSCRQFEDRPCMTHVQYNQTGRCLDSRNSLKTLKCCSVPNNRGQGMTNDIVWADPNLCVN